MKNVFAICFIIALFSGVALGADDFAPPKDNVFSEKQLTESIAVTKDWMESAKAAGKAMEGSQSTALALATIAQTDQKFKDALAKHNLSQGEYSWISEQAWTAYGVLVQVDMFDGDQAHKDFADQMKKQTDALAAAKTKLADLDAAQKSGRKILTSDERASIVESAKSDEQSATDEAKGHADEAKQAADDAAKADKDASDADKLAKNPPADVGADDKEQYIKDRNADADTARQAAKEARDRQAAANAAQKESEAKIASAKAKQKDPDVPLTDDEKAEVKKQTDDDITSSKAEIDQLNAAVQTLNDAAAQAKKMADDAAKNAPKENVELLRKHRADFEAIFGQKK